MQERIKRLGDKISLDLVEAVYILAVPEQFSQSIHCELANVLNVTQKKSEVLIDKS